MEILIMLLQLIQHHLDIKSNFFEVSTSVSANGVFKV